MADTPTLYVCHGDDGGPRRHPCRRVQEALRAAEIEYEKVIAAHGHWPACSRGARAAAPGHVPPHGPRELSNALALHRRGLVSYRAGYVRQGRRLLARAALELRSVSTPR